uniref:Uncharacterized protein n=1 Tax=Romanomermis culicivorax TaxID=13658 RepID=A0A915KGN2_ROMCU
MSTFLFTSSKRDSPTFCLAPAVTTTIVELAMTARQGVHTEIQEKIYGRSTRGNSSNAGRIFASVRRRVSEGSTGLLSSRSLKILKIDTYLMSIEYAQAIPTAPTPTIAIFDPFPIVSAPAVDDGVPTPRSSVFVERFLRPLRLDDFSDDDDFRLPPPPLELFFRRSLAPLELFLFLHSTLPSALTLTGGDFSSTKLKAFYEPNHFHTTEQL